MNYRGVCRTAPATPGLLNIYIYIFPLGSLIDQTLTHSSFCICSFTLVSSLSHSSYQSDGVKDFYRHSIFIKAERQFMFLQIMSASQSSLSFRLCYLTARSLRYIAATWHLFKAMKRKMSIQRCSRS